MAGVKEVDSTDRFSLADVGRDGRSSGEKKMKEESNPPMWHPPAHERATRPGVAAPAPGGTRLVLIALGPEGRDL